MKKIYRIRITGASKPNIWYINKIDQEYDAELHARADHRIIVFEVNPCQFVYPIDCIIIGERLVEKYTK